MILFRNATNHRRIENWVRAGRLLRLTKGVYSTDLETDPAWQVRQNLIPILATLRPGAVISHRSALREDFGAEEGLVTLTDPTITQNYLISLPGVRVVVIPGPGPTPYDRDLGVGKTIGQMEDSTIHVSGLWRAILENLEPRRVVRALGQPITVSASDLKTFLADHLSTPEDVDRLQENIALGLSAAPHWRREAAKADRLLQRRRQDLAASAPFSTPGVDQRRVALFEDLARQLMRGIHGNESLWDDGLPDFPGRPTAGDRRFLNAAFYESYFSNYIEGTKFDPEDARAIALGRNAEREQRKEGHDIRALYKMYANPELFLRADRTADEFLANLKDWHGIFGAHVDKEMIHPGRFKDARNFAGSTAFVDPAQVEGTLRAAWEIGEHLLEPFDRAVFRAVSTVSIHPFLDGNGRITRLAAANVLGRAGKMRFLIPNVFREDYILVLRAFSNGNPVPVIRMFRRAMEISASIPFDKPFPELTRWLKERNAFLDPDDGKWRDAPVARKIAQEEGDPSPGMG